MLRKLIVENRESILAQWTEKTISTYTPEMVRFLKTEKNQFANPVRNTIVENIGKVLDGILDENRMEDCYLGLEEIIKLRAVQDFLPSKALSFLFDLKKIVREELQASNSSGAVEKEFQTFESNLDKLIGFSFDIYTQCRDKIHDIRIAEIKARTQGIFDTRGKAK